MLVIERFLAAVTTGDLESLMEVLAPDVVAIADGGGLAPALRRPVTGALLLAEYMVRFREAPGFVVTRTWLNGMPAVRADFGDVTAVMSLVVEAGRITRIYAINNPEKLGHIERLAELTR